MNSLKVLKRGNNEESYSSIMVYFNNKLIINTWEYYRGIKDLTKTISCMCENRTSLNMYHGKTVNVIIRQYNDVIVNTYIKI